MAISKCTCTLFVVTLFAITGQGFTATINVPADQPTIQAGINAAVSGVDEVVVAPGTYNEIINFGGKAITVRSSGGAAVTTIDATGVPALIDGKPVVRCENGETASTVLDGFTITGGTGDTLQFGGPSGGGMFNDGASPTVTNCTFSGNTASSGGGMFNFHASPTVNNCTFSGNSAAGGGFKSGGGMYNNKSNPTVTNCVFSGNTASGFGGGMLNQNANPTVTNCVFSGNTANGSINSAGGGMSNAGGSPTVTDCTFSGNSSESGGGMLNQVASPTVTNCTFSGNTATFGGGMLNSSSSPTVINCTFSGNTATVNGGGMSNINGSPMVTNCTFSGNTATVDGGGMVNGNASPTVTNGIFWGNSDAGGMDESAQIYVSGGTPVVNYSDVQGGWTGAGVTGNINVDPLFVNAAGGDLHLQAGSPCINAGDNSVVTELTDLDGNLRIVNCTVDMGAYENQTASATLVHNLTQDTFFGTIQAAIDAAVANDVIEVSPCTYNEIIDFNGKAITVRSTDPTDPAVVAATIIDATGVPDPGDGLPVVRCDNGETASTVLDGFTITGGTGDTILFGGAPVGGGMFNSGSSPTVTNCTFSGITSMFGGGMFNFFSGPTVTNCTFSGNTTELGGGMYNFGNPSTTVINCMFSGNTASSGAGMFNTGSDTTVINCTFNNNNGDTAGGGGIYNEAGDATVTNCVFSGNMATSGGGMYVAISGSMTTTNCTFSGNAATNDGGGMYHIGGTLMVTNCILWGNSDAGGMDESAQIHVASGAPTVDYSDVQGGWTGAGGVGNINADPLFVDAAGEDLRLLSGSPCIDAGNNSVVTTTKDVIGQPRKAEDLLTVDTGAGTPPIVDMGAYEFVHPGDADGDGDVDGNDFLTFSNCINGSLNPPKPGCLNLNLDLDGDGDIDGDDFLTFTSCFNGSLNPPACP